MPSGIEVYTHFQAFVSVKNDGNGLSMIRPCHTSTTYISVYFPCVMYIIHKHFLHLSFIDEVKYLSRVLPDKSVQNF